MRLLNTLLLTILLLEGCGVTTIEGLEEQVKACRKGGGDCVALEKTLDKRYERHYLDVENAQRWERCKLVYAKLGRRMWSYHDHPEWRQHTAMDVKLDLSLNNCRMILKQIDLW